MSDEYRSEVVIAFVTLNEGDEVSKDELVSYCKERIADYKYPCQIEFLDELPKERDRLVPAARAQGRSTSRGVERSRGHPAALGPDGLHLATSENKDDEPAREATSQLEYMREDYMCESLKVCLR